MESKKIRNDIYSIIYDSIRKDVDFNELRKEIKPILKKHYDVRMDELAKDNKELRQAIQKYSDDKNANKYKKPKIFKKKEEKPAKKNDEPYFNNDFLS